MRRLIPVLVTALLFLAACGTDATSDTEPDGAGSQSAPSKALDFTATTLDGEELRGEQLAGKPAVVWFWAPWCPTCRAQIPNLTKLAETYDGEVSFVGAGGLDDADTIRRTADSIPHLIHLVDEEGTVWRHFGVTEQSTYEVIDADGKIVSSGYLDDGDLTDLVSELVADLAG